MGPERREILGHRIARDLLDPTAQQRILFERELARVCGKIYTGSWLAELQSIVQKSDMIAPQIQIPSHPLAL